jgi:hypothetical protein
MAGNVQVVARKRRNAVEFMQVDAAGNDARLFPCYAKIDKLAGDGSADGNDVIGGAVFASACRPAIFLKAIATRNNQRRRRTTQKSAECSQAVSPCGMGVHNGRAASAENVTHSHERGRQSRAAKLYGENLAACVSARPQKRTLLLGHKETLMSDLQKPGNKQKRLIFAAAPPARIADMDYEAHKRLTLDKVVVFKPAKLPAAQKFLFE